VRQEGGAIASSNHQKQAIKNKKARKKNNYAPPRNTRMAMGGLG